MTGYKTIRAVDLGQMTLPQGIVIDVRTKMEHDEKRLKSNHIHVPLDDLNPADFMMRRGLDKGAAVYILCRSGKRAAQAAEKFNAAGYANIFVVDGGLMACEECGHAVEGHTVQTNASAHKDAAPLSLERQVRVAAGLLAGVGALLGLVVHPLFTIIPLFVGGGLVFAGITDRCGMALILTKAPWNTKAGQSAPCCASTKGCG